MNTPNTSWLAPRLLGAALLLLCAAPVTWAQGKVDDKLMQRYGGVLAPECGNYLRPQLLYLGDSPVVRDGGKPMLTGRNVKAAPTHFGAAPPPEFATALSSEVAGNEYQLASVCKDHDCYDSNMVLLYAAVSQIVYAKEVQRGHSVSFGRSFCKRHGRGIRLRASADGEETENGRGRMRDDAFRHTDIGRHERRATRADRGEPGGWRAATRRSLLGLSL